MPTMRNFKKGISLALMLGSVVIPTLLAGCSGGDDAGDKPKLGAGETYAPRPDKSKMEMSPKAQKANRANRGDGD